MGHRANFVVLENNTAQAFYDQWAAMGCVYTFADGPTSALDAIAEMETADELMDWAFAEGGYLIDRDKQVALVFGMPFEEDDLSEGMPEDLAARMRAINGALAKGERDYLLLIAPKWKGWKIVWDDRGVDAFGLYLQERGIAGLKLQPPSYPDSTKPPVMIEA